MRFAKLINTVYGPDVWTKQIAFYLDGVSFALKPIHSKQHEHPKQESGESLAKVYRLDAQQKGGKKELAVNL